MSTRGFLIIEDENENEAFVYLDGDAYPDEVEGAVTAFLNANTNGDLYGMTAKEKAESLVEAVEAPRRAEGKKIFSILRGDGTTKEVAIEYSPWLTVTRSTPSKDLLENGRLFTLTHRYELFAGRRLSAERTNSKVKPRFHRA